MMTQMSRDSLAGAGAGDHGRGAAADHRHNQRAAWLAAVARLRLDRADRLVAGHIAEAADRNGRTCKTVAELAESCWLSITILTEVLADLSSRALLARGGDRLALVLPDGGPACG
jgi:hypothetical protein